MKKANIITFFFLIFISIRALAQQTPQLTLTGNKEGVNVCAFSPDGKTMISGNKDGVIRIWDVQANYNPVKEIVTGDDAITALHFNNKGDRFIAGTLNMFLIYNSTTYKLIAKKKKAHVTFVKSCSYSGDDALLVTTSWKENAISIWEGESLKKVKDLSENIWTDEAFFTPDNKQIISCNHDNVAKVWDIQTGNIIKTFAGHDDWVYAVKITSDMKTLITGSFDKTIKLWDYSSGKLLTTLTGHKDGISTIAISPDNRFVASGSVDGNIILWDIISGKQATVISEKGPIVLFLCYSPDGKTLLACNSDKTIQVWNVSTFQ